MRVYGTVNYSLIVLRYRMCPGCGHKFISAEETTGRQPQCRKKKTPPEPQLSLLLLASN
jgi:hypothetical protein